MAARFPRRLTRALLAAYPPWFRRQYAVELEELLRRRWSDAAGRRRGRAAFWWEVTADCLGAAGRLHLRTLLLPRWGDPRARPVASGAPRRLAVAAAVLAVAVGGLGLALDCPVGKGGPAVAEVSAEPQPESGCPLCALLRAAGRDTRPS